MSLHSSPSWLTALFLFCTSLSWAELRTETRSLHLGPITGEASPYVYLPFDVPVSTTEVRVLLEYDRRDGENAIDFAIFDATFSGQPDDLTGYRGKNPNRAPLLSIIGRDRASYGHMSGPMPPGTWRVMFYVYKSAAQGVDVTVKISTVTDELPTMIHGKAQWSKGDLHTHTLHSDGTWTIPTLAAAAQESGLDFVAVTDHNTASHHAEVDAFHETGLTLIRGIELTTYGGHANVWGLPTGAMIEHRQLPLDERAFQTSIDQAHRMGALISINHPFADCKACSWAFGSADFDSIEVWNAEWGPEDQLAVDWWERLLKSGQRITAIGSSDSHGPQNPVGRPTTHVRADGSNIQEILNGIRRGNVYVTSAPAIEVDFKIYSGNFQWGPGEEAVITGTVPLRVNVSINGLNEGAIFLYSSGEVRRWPVRGLIFTLDEPITSGASYFRLEVRDVSGAMVVLTNPVWLKH